MQSAQLTREHELRCRDLMILRYDRQRQLCDEIITKQRILIDSLATGEKSKNANARKELNELYRIYQQEIQDLNNGRTSDLSQLSLYDSLYRPTSSGLRPLGSSGSMLELHQLDSNKSPSEYRGSRVQNPLPPIAPVGENGDGDKRLFLRRRRQPCRRGSDDDSIGAPHLPPLSNNPLDLRNRRANSRFSNSSSNSSTSVTDRSITYSYRSSSINSPLESAPYSNGSSNGGSSDSSDHYRDKLKKVEEFEEPLKKRFGILPSLRVRKGRGTSSDSEVLVYNKNMCNDRGIHSNKKLNQLDRRQEIAEVRRNKHWSNSKALGY
ncbi:kinesin-like protein [Caerostris darwini]|uniref:Kinesin-like protein n=1 Tax=Caerostris darwini TaxID=1538125 RepID=A0AAV4RZB6_9ARAC|nr:kinesin-like protein [Caerostris darwini]